MTVAHGPFEHYCHCGEWGAWGYGVGLPDPGRRDPVTGKALLSPGAWFCAAHRPAEPDRFRAPAAPTCGESQAAVPPPRAAARSGKLL